MARKKSPTLTEGELRLMDIIWEKGEATVNQVLSALSSTKAPAYNTVLTILRILEKKGYLHHIKKGRAHIYRPLVGREQARHKAIRQMLKSFFDNSPELLLQNIIDSKDISEKELQRLKKMINES